VNPACPLWAGRGICFCELTVTNALETKTAKLAILQGMKGIGRNTSEILPPFAARHMFIPSWWTQTPTMVLSSQACGLLFVDC
jgi:hypothetical protein